MSHPEASSGSSKGIWAVLAAIALVPVLVVVLFIAGAGLLVVTTAGDSADSGSSEVCPSGEGVIPIGTLPQSVAGFSGVQLENAAAIIKAGADLGLSRRGQTIAVMTAIGESTLQVLDYGDGPGPDSRGLFQQRANGAWGSYEDRMDPYRSSTSFYRALMKVPGWEAMEPTLAAHAVQRNADPFHYRRSWSPAEEVVAALVGETAGTPVFGTSTTGQTCGTVGAAGPVVAGWTVPIPGITVNSGFGMRKHPISGKYLLHAGVDLPAACGTSVFAAGGGTVTWAGLARPGSGRTGNQVEIDHGGGIITTYGHLLTGGFAVQVGQTVQPGQLIAGSGGDPRTDPSGAGGSTGCHLHFQTFENGQWINPVDFMAARGLTFGQAAVNFDEAVVGGAPDARLPLAFAQQQLGKNYSQTIQGGCGPDWWDCSCLMREAWATAGKTLPRVTGAQWAATTRITRDQLQTGDLVFWSDNGNASGIYHVAMYVGDGKVLHAPRPGRTVEVVTMWEVNILGYGRV